MFSSSMGRPPSREKHPKNTAKKPYFQPFAVQRDTKRRGRCAPRTLAPLPFFLAFLLVSTSKSIRQDA